MSDEERRREWASEGDRARAAADAILFGVSFVEHCEDGKLRRVDPRKMMPHYKDDAYEQQDT